MRSFVRQALLAEFAALAAAKPDGIYVTVTPGDSAHWTGVLFVREGPYAPAILRFQILFIDSYPSSAPLVTFSTDIFHPLINPLTTYTYTSTQSDSDTLSATEQDRLPPGGFSLRHGFPQWFVSARGVRSSASSISESSAVRPIAKSNVIPTNGDDVPVLRVLQYIRSTFSDESVLDSIPLEAAANSGAYHAWRSYRSEKIAHQQGMLSEKATSATTSDVRSKRPGEWNWEGVWEERVKKAVRASISEPILFGGGVSDSLIRFSYVDQEMMDKVMETLHAKASEQTVVT